MLSLRKQAVYWPMKQGKTGCPSRRLLAGSLSNRPVYNHIESIDALRLDLSFEASRRRAKRFALPTAGRAADDAVRVLAKAYRDFSQTQPGLYEAVPIAPEHQEGEAHEASRPSVDIVCAVLSGYVLSGHATVHAARLLRSALHGFIALEVHGGCGLPATPGKPLALLAGTLVKGLRAPLLPPARPAPRPHEWRVSRACFSSSRKPVRRLPRGT
jgi:hypothetical protein